MSKIFGIQVIQEYMIILLNVISVKPFQYVSCSCAIALQMGHFLGENNQQTLAQQTLFSHLVSRNWACEQNGRQ